jgi:hypothetical protein
MAMAIVGCWPLAIGHWPLIEPLVIFNAIKLKKNKKAVNPKPEARSRSRFPPVQRAESKVEASKKKRGGGGGGVGAQPGVGTQTSGPLRTPDLLTPPKPDVKPHRESGEQSAGYMGICDGS